MPMDLRQAINAISDVTENRPLPLREFDQIYMKAGDMVLHAEFAARRFAGKDVVFVGDGDAIGAAVIHLSATGILPFGPSSVTVLDFDERVVNSVIGFASHYGYEDRLSSQLYNVIDVVPPPLLMRFGAFHINPPWGQHNSGESVLVFLERAEQLLSADGVGIMVIADDEELLWTQQVLQRSQATALERGMIVSEMIPGLHQYHLDDAPDLRSCALVFRKIAIVESDNIQLNADRLANFYGRENEMRVKYVREVGGLGRRQADDRTYKYDLLESSWQTSN